VLFYYIIEGANAIVFLIFVPCLGIIYIGPMPLYAAQAAFTAIHSCGSLLAALGSAISLFHMLYVTQFEAVFAMDPHAVGKKVLLSLTLVTGVPNLIVSIYNTVQGLHSAPGVARFTGTEYNNPGVSFLNTYTLCWMALFLILSCIAYVFIPCILRYRQTSVYNENPPRRTNTLQRFLFGALGLLILFIASFILGSQKVQKPRITSNAALMSLLSFNLFLLFLVTESEVKAAVKRYIFNILQIQEMFVPENNLNSVGQCPSSNVIASPMTASAMAASTMTASTMTASTLTASTMTKNRNMLPLRTVIIVSPVSVGLE